MKRDPFIVEKDQRWVERQKHNKIMEKARKESSNK